MTSEIDVSKTNEFLRRRKLRLQQVREQSKDIAKKIRQRAKVEKLRHVINLDSRKEKEYFDLQEKFVGRLEQLYSESLQNVGTGHKNAVKILDQEEGPKKDLSKLRGREAVAELRKRKQEILDEQKKFLDRKLQAREAANELSREKCTSVSKTISSKAADNIQKTLENPSVNTEINNNQQKDKTDTDISKHDMGTQWEGDGLPNEWGSSVPRLSLPKDDKDSLKHSENDKERSDPKRINLFALSDEMPSSLRGGNSFVASYVPQQKSSLTLVSEYLQTRNLRLREADPVSTKKSDDLQSLKETIIRSRASETNGNFSNVCHVLDKQLIPVPSWKAEDDICYHCQQHTSLNSIKPVLIKKTYPFQRSDLCSRSMMKGSLHRNTKLYNTPVSGKSEQSKSAADNTLNRKHSVTMYNHSTRDTRDIVYNNERHVIRDENIADDAYTMALKETSMINDAKNIELEKKKEALRNKVAVTKEKVDKEYKDTLAFLSSLSKENTSKPYNTSFMDQKRQQMQIEKHQRKLQEEFRKIERECSRQTCKHKNRSASLNKSRSKSRSPDICIEPPRNFQYDWMPVPETDGKLTVHSIPSTRNQKTSNTVKFNDVDTYHEYRSRHKHTPPTKDVPKNREKKKVFETLIIEQNSSETTDASSVTSDSNSIEYLGNDKNRTDKDFLNDPRLSDGDRIVIYKILDSKRDKKRKDDRKTKVINKVFKSTNTTENGNNERDIDSQENTQHKESISFPVKQGVALDNLNEGIYKVSENGDNIASMYFAENSQDANNIMEQQDVCKKSTTCQNVSEQQQYTRSNIPSSSRCEHSCFTCKCSKPTQQPQTSAATSTSSFQTAANDKTGNLMADGGFIKLIDDSGQDSGKFYIGASGFLKDDNYEVVIQLKKKETEKLDKKTQEVFVDTVENVPSPTKNLSKVDSEVLSSLGINLKESAAQTSINQEIIDNNKNEPCSKSESVLVDEEACTTNVLNEDYKTKSKMFVDKNVCTTFQDSFAIPVEVPKTDPVVRPATSTYTQTSFSSPNSRPVFMHMTSSTSTAYMSPPELILPRFLRQNRVFCADDDLLTNNYDEKYDDGFLSNKCKCTRKTTSNEKIRKCNHICSTTDTPPNTARSYDYIGSVSENAETEKPKHRHNSKTCRKTHRHKSNFTLHRESSKSIRGVNSAAILPNKSVHKMSHTLNVANKHGFNPVVKEYVNKLLALNKEGLTAIQVINQDCSSVDTPRSSIINTPYNVTKNVAPVENKISLEQIKIMLEQQIVQDYAKRAPLTRDQLHHTEKQNKNMSKLPRRRQVHKVKSLNISRQLLKNKNSHSQVNFKNSTKPQSTSSSAKDTPLHRGHNVGPEVSLKRRSRSKSSPTPRRPSNDIAGCNDRQSMKRKIVTPIHQQPSSQGSSNSTQRSDDGYRLRLHRTTSISTDSERRDKQTRSFLQIPPTDISTQTSGIDSEINYMKLAENKLQNMEKIADLTEKCTKRLSNLAKVLEEVRRNKSLVYSHISTSDSTSDSEPKHHKITDNNAEILQSDETLEKPNNQKAIFDCPLQDNMQKVSTYMPLLKDIPKPLTPSTLSLSTISEKSNIPTSTSSVEQTKHKAKPPPALSRINLKNAHNHSVIPHELSTVMEVDSPMSVKLKNQSTQREPKSLPNERNENQPEYQTDLDLQPNKSNSSQIQSKASSGSPDDAKIEMMDMKLFNDIMLKPFVSLHEYAKQCNVRIDEASNIEDVVKDEVCDELSSLRSDGSLPDVISELLRRKIISEPFKFDTASHATNSLSSESSLSLLALSKMYKEKKKVNRSLVNKENMTETSETLSISSNPDLENAFQKLGLGWASSTLKKTKERLALSSSSNTSSSSYSQLKFKNFNKDLPSIATDTTFSEQNDSNRRSQSKNIGDSAKNAVQQTSLTNSMTVKEFLTNELAKKITFTNKSNRTDDEFISLYETKMPDEIRNSPVKIVEDEQSLTSQGNNRAKTSTPVQIFKSITYHTTSSSNTSNGLFSNADELSSVKVTSTSIQNHSTSDKDDLTIPNYSLKRKGLSDNSKSD